MRKFARATHGPWRLGAPNRPRLRKNAQPWAYWEAVENGGEFVLYKEHSPRLDARMREVLERHQRICDDLYQLALDENQFLVEKKRPFGPDLLQRRQALLDQLTSNLDALKQALAPAATDVRALAELKEKVRQRILQIIHLDRENEKLILRYSLQSRGAPATSAPAAPPPAGSVARLYGKVLPPGAR